MKTREEQSIFNEAEEEEKKNESEQATPNS